MRNRDELERMYRDRSVPARDVGSIDLLVIRRAPGRHETPVEAQLSCEHGLLGDRWVKGGLLPPDRDRQLTLMMTQVAELVCDGQPLDLPGDNLLVNLDLGENALPVGSKMRAGEALIEVTAKPHTGCKKFQSRFGASALAWINDEAGRSQRLRGLNCRVIEPGTVRIGDVIRVVSR